MYFEEDQVVAFYNGIRLSHEEVSFECTIGNSNIFNLKRIYVLLYI